MAAQRMVNQGDCYVTDNDILNAISERTDNALSLIDSCDSFLLNNLRVSTNNRSLLHLCVGIGWYKAVIQLLKRSLDVNTIDNEGNTPLMLALNLPKTDILKCLLSYEKTNVNYQRTIDGCTVVHLACLNDRSRHLKILLQQRKHRIDLKLKTLSNENFLHLISDFKCKKSLKILHQFSFNDDLWNEKSNQGYTPLFIAVIRWPYSSFTRHLLRLLLNLSSTSLHTKDNHGKTILHWAIFNHHLVKLINDNRWLMLDSIQDRYGKIPLDYAYEQHLLKSVQYLRT